MKEYYDQERFRTDKRPWHGEFNELTQKKSFKFAVIGDRTGFALEGEFEGALDMVKQLAPDFVLSVGDLIEGYRSDKNTAHQEWDEIDRHIEQLRLPFFRAIGNHDCGSELMMDVWRERYGLEYYAFRYANMLFLIVNTEDPPVPIADKYVSIMRDLEQLVQHDPVNGEAEIQAFFAQLIEPVDAEQEAGGNTSHIDERQFEFIHQMLEQHIDVDWTFVIMHRPLWKTNDPNYSRLDSLLKDRRHTVFAGHLHDLEVTGSQESYRIQMGRTGACKHREHLHDFQHILWVHVEDGTPSFQVIKLEQLSTLESFRKA
ncbi:metallophosphoesterase family protein [Paenibacillus phytorum]|nr:metallophosphoesterase [Paenibacillus phytorum]